MVYYLVVCLVFPHCQPVSIFKVPSCFSLKHLWLSIITDLIIGQWSLSSPLSIYVLRLWSRSADRIIISDLLSTSCILCRRVDQVSVFCTMNRLVIVQVFLLCMEGWISWILLSELHPVKWLLYAFGKFYFPHCPVLVPYVGYQPSAVLTPYVVGISGDLRVCVLI